MLARPLGAAELSRSVGALTAVAAARSAPRGEPAAAPLPASAPVARPRASAAASPAPSAPAPAVPTAATAPPTAPAAAAASRSAPAPASSAPCQPRPRAASEQPVAPDVARRLYLRARELIRSLASQITENTEDGRVRFRADDQLLATLKLDQEGFRMQIGDATGDGPLVTGDALLDEKLNELFVLYFSRMGPEIILE
jgi:hypothetical protein